MEAEVALEVAGELEAEVELEVEVGLEAEVELEAEVQVEVQVPVEVEVELDLEVEVLEVEVLLWVPEVVDLVVVVLDDFRPCLLVDLGSLNSHAAMDRL